MLSNPGGVGLFRKRVSCPDFCNRDARQYLAHGAQGKVVRGREFVTLLELFLEVEELLAEFCDFVSQRCYLRFDGGDAGVVVSGSSVARGWEWGCIVGGDV